MLTPPPSPWGGGGVETAVPFLAPVGQMGGIESFAAQQCSELPGLAGIRLPQDAHLVGRLELAATDALRDLRIRWGCLQVRG